MSEEYRSCVVRLQSGMMVVRDLLAEGRDRIAINHDATPEFYDWLKAWHDRLCAQALVVAAEADALWRHAIAELRERVTLSDSQRAALVEAGDSALATDFDGTVDGALSSIDGIRRQFMSAAIESVFHQGVLAPKHVERLAKYAKAILSDHIPYSATIEEVLRDLVGLDFDRDVWERLALPGRQALCMEMLTWSNVIVDFTLMVARASLEYAQTTYEELSGATEA